MNFEEEKCKIFYNNFLEELYIIKDGTFKWLSDNIASNKDFICYEYDNGKRLQYKPSFKSIYSGGKEVYAVFKKPKKIIQNKFAILDMN